MIKMKACLCTIFCIAALSLNLNAKDGEENFIIADKNYSAEIYIDKAGSEYDGLSIIAEAFANDVYLVSGKRPQIITDSNALSGKMPVIAGVIDENKEGVVESLISSHVIDVSDIRGKWETYKIQLIENPLQGVSKALVIVGSDKRGAIYGLFHVSELMGVSPWVYYGDVLPAHKDKIVFSQSELFYTSKEPSVKYRGIFLNDEAPNLTSWTDKKFGGRNKDFYATMFEVILRLKGNYLWPAMWGDEFSKGGNKGLGNSVSPLASAELADKYGIVMGTSHHEPMCRAGNEWSQEYRKYLKQKDADLGSKATWDYFKYGYAIKNFWKDGYERNKAFENLVTVGMRGEADSSLGLSLSDSILNLKNVITEQLSIMKNANEKEQKLPPTMLCLYKEVEDYWYGGNEKGKEIAGLKDWKVKGQNPLDNTVIMLCDDNFGNLRTLPHEDERERKGGWGMYYHFDYVGGPHTYKWIATNQLEKTWENMTTAYEYGIKEVWIVNVGDFKPMEINTSYFLDLAYDYEKYSRLNSAYDYYKDWAMENFGSQCSEKTVEEIACILKDYLKMNGARKPEKNFPSTFSLANYNEAQIQLKKANDLYKRAFKTYEDVPEKLKDAYYQLVLYPAAASANIERWCIYSALNSMYADEGSMLANLYAALTDECKTIDESLRQDYNKKISSGKWDGLMSRELHIGYNNWNSSYSNPRSYVEPVGKYILPEAEGNDELLINLDSKAGILKSDEEIFFLNTGSLFHSLSISHIKSSEFNYTINCDKNWLKIDKKSGVTNTGDVVNLSVDWNALKDSDSSYLTISALNSQVKIKITAQKKDLTSLKKGLVYPENGIACVLAKNYSSKKGEWLLIKNYGREESSLKAAEITSDFSESDAPYLEYNFYVEKDGDYYLTVYTSPANNRQTGGRLAFGISANGGSIIKAYALDEKFVVGDGNTQWGKDCISNAHATSCQVNLRAGENKIRFYSLDSGSVLQKLALSSEKTLPTSAFGPKPTYIGGNIVSDLSTNTEIYTGAYNPEKVLLVPGLIPASQKTVSFILTKNAPYTITLAATADKNAKIKLLLDENTIITPVYDSKKNAFTAELSDLSVGKHTLSYSVESGKAEISAFDITLNDGLKKIELINNDFSDENQGKLYEAYLPGDGRLSLVDGKLLEQGFASGWKASNGIRSDITQLVKKAVSSTFGASVNVYSTASGASSIFLEIVSSDGSKKTYDFASSSEYVDNNLSLRGEVENVTFTASDKVYLCVTQWSGFTSFDNIKLWFYSDGKERVLEDKKITTLFRHTFDKNKSSEISFYQPYENNNGKISAGNNPVMKVEKSGDGKGGIKINLTKNAGLTKSLSGHIFGASANVKPGYGWGASDIVELFFEIISEKGENRKIPLVKAKLPDYVTSKRTDSDTGADLGSNWIEKGLGGEVQLEFMENETIYLCITSTNNPMWIDDVRFYYCE